MGERTGLLARPAPLVRVAAVVAALAALGLVASLASIVFGDYLVATWWGGVGQTVDDARVAPSYGPVVMVLYVTLALLVAVLVAFLLDGHGWARHALALTLGLVGLGTVAGLLTGPPVGYLVFAGASLALEATAVALLYRPEVGRHLA